MNFSHTILPMFIIAFMWGFFAWLTLRSKRNNHPYIVVASITLYGILAIQWLSIAIYCVVGLNLGLSEAFGIHVTLEILKQIIQVVLPIISIIPAAASLLTYWVVKRWFPNKERISNEH